MTFAASWLACRKVYTVDSVCMYSIFLLKQWVAGIVVALTGQFR